MGYVAELHDIAEAFVTIAHFLLPEIPSSHGSSDNMLSWFPSCHPNCPAQSHAQISFSPYFYSPGYFYILYLDYIIQL